jgi:hypothetical protein
MALAFLTKPQGLVVSGAWMMLLALDRRSWRLFLYNATSFLIIVLLVWPQSWFSPVISIFKYIYAQYALTHGTKAVPNYYFGPTMVPNWTYYFFQITVRTPESILGLALLGIAYLKRGIKSIAFKSISIYFILYFVAITIAGSKAGIRYALPLLPYIYVAAGFGLRWVLGLKHKLIRYSLVGLIVLSVLYPLSFFPDYYLYYNQLLGGPGAAARYDLIGPCLGTKQALEYLDKNDIQGLTGIVGCYDTGPYHSSRPQTKDWGKADILILETSYAQQYPNSDFVSELTKRTPLYVVIEKGAVLSRIYKVR